MSESIEHLSELSNFRARSSFLITPKEMPLNIKNTTPVSFKPLLPSRPHKNSDTVPELSPRLSGSRDRQITKMDNMELPRRKSLKLDPKILGSPSLVVPPISRESHDESHSAARILFAEGASERSSDTDPEDFSVSEGSDYSFDDFLDLGQSPWVGMAPVILREIHGIGELMVGDMALCLY